MRVCEDVVAVALVCSAVEALNVIGAGGCQYKSRQRRQSCGKMRLGVICICQRLQINVPFSLVYHHIV